MLVMIEAHRQPGQVTALYVFILEVCTHNSPSTVCYFDRQHEESTPYASRYCIDIDANATLVDGIDQLRRIR